MRRSKRKSGKNSIIEILLTHTHHFVHRWELSYDRLSLECEGCVQRVLYELGGCWYLRLVRLSATFISAFSFRGNKLTDSPSPGVGTTFSFDPLALPFRRSNLGRPRLTDPLLPLITSGLKKRTFATPTVNTSAFSGTSSPTSPWTGDTDLDSESK
jgi:hypothetical protein